MVDLFGFWGFGVCLKTYAMFILMVGKCFMRLMLGDCAATLLESCVLWLFERLGFSVGRS